MSQAYCYIAIDLKSFYASVECVERGLDPLCTNLVVADKSRTAKTICLAVSPSLKAYGIAGRPRLFEVEQRVDKINRERQRRNKWRPFVKTSYLDPYVRSHPDTALGYITASPRMALYLRYSALIYQIYLKYVAPEDIHVYSIDEVFMDVTGYLKTYKMTGRQLAGKMIKDVLKETGITATAGIGTNLYLAKVAMDILAKHTEPDENGVRIAELDEIGYRRRLWTHRPLTDFWRIGPGYAAKLEANGMMTMGDVARCSLGKFTDKKNEDLLYRLFGVNAELLIDHAWGYESCSMRDIKAYRPLSRSLSQGQVLMKPYSHEKGSLIVKEMSDLLALELARKKLVCDGIDLYIGYDGENLSDPRLAGNYHGEVACDFYGRLVPQSAHGSERFAHPTASPEVIMNAASDLYSRITDPALTIRRVNITLLNTRADEVLKEAAKVGQLDLFGDAQQEIKDEEQRVKEEEKERKMQEAVLKIKAKYGKNAVLKGMNLAEDAMTIKRNDQIGGHKA